MIKNILHIIKELKKQNEILTQQLERCKLSRDTWILERYMTDEALEHIQDANIELEKIGTHND